MAFDILTPLNTFGRIVIISGFQIGEWLQKFFYGASTSTSFGFNLVVKGAEQLQFSHRKIQ